MKQKIVLCVTGVLTVFIGLSVLTTCNGSGPKGTGCVPAIAESIIIPPDTRKPVVNVYIENTESMYGYVNGSTDFKDIIHNYLSDIIISDVTEGMNLFYINNIIIPHQGSLFGFIQGLNPTIFKNKGGDISSTDNSKLLDTISKETSKETISILVSDFIFSPGRGIDAAKYLRAQQIGIRVNFVQYLNNNPNMAVCIYQLSSQFKGRYFNRVDAPTNIDNRRPFYICIIGDRQHLTKLQSSVPLSKFIGNGVENIFTIMQGNQKVDYAIRPGTGSFNLDKKNPKQKITKAKKDHSGKQTFSVDANLSGFLLESDYLKNENNYILNDKDYQLQVTDSPSGSKGYTHSFRLSSDKVKPSCLSIKLKTNIPEWVEMMNDDEGLDINADGAMKKTYGISFLINGIHGAFTHRDSCYTEIKISINQ